MFILPLLGQNKLILILILLQSTMLQAIERYLKQAIVDKVHAVSSAALTSSLVSLLWSLGFVTFKIHSPWLSVSSRKQVARLSAS